MKFANWARYTSDQDLLRETRPLHRAYVTNLVNCGKVILGGPFEDDSGCLLVYEAKSIDEVNKLIADDPYTNRKVYVSWEVKPWDCLGANKHLLPGS